jgi:hypothetical protein
VALPAFRAAGAVSVGSTSVFMASGPAAQNTDGVLLFVMTKPDTATIVTPTGWTLVADVAGGGGTTGNGTGPTRQAVFFREKDASWSTWPTVAVTNGNATAIWAIAYSKTAGTVWEVAASTSTYGVAAASTNGSATHGSNPGLTATDRVVVGYSNQDELPTWSAQGVTATGVSAWGTVTERSEIIETTTGNDMGGMVFDTSVTTGTATAAPVTAATLSAAGRGTVVLVRLRESTPELDPPVTETFASGAWSQWVTPSAAPTVSGGAGVMTGTTAAAVQAHINADASPPTDQGVLLNVTFSAAGSFAVGLRSDETWDSGTAFRQRNGYMLRFDTAIASLIKMTNNVQSTLDSTGGTVATAGTAYKVRVEAVGTTIRARMWASSSAEPGVWHLEGTDSAHTAGTLSLGWTPAINGNTATVDNIEWYVPNALPFTDDFASGNWNKWRTFHPDNATKTVSSGVGVLTDVSGVGYAGATPSVVDVADEGFLVSVQQPSAQDSDFVVAVRGSGPWTTASSNYPRPTTGYYAVFQMMAGNHALFLYRADAASPTQIGSTLTNPLANGHTNVASLVRIRVEAVGTTVRAKMWLASGSEPGSWQITATDSTHTAAGYPHVGYRDASFTTPTFRVDDAEVYAASAGVTNYDGTATRTATATITAAGTVDTGPPVGYDGTATRTATATLTAAGATGTATGASLAATATLTAAGTVARSTSSTLAATATTTAAGTVATSTGAARTATATITAAGATDRATGASLAATATTTAAGSTGSATGATIAATATLTSAGVAVAGTGASLAATGTITAAGNVATSSGASLAATGTVTAAGATHRATGASLAAIGTVTAAGATGSSTGASLAATATTTAAGATARSTGASLAATATTTAAGATDRATGATRTATATLTAAGAVAAASGASLAATGTITAAGSVGKSTGAVLAATGTISPSAGSARQSGAAIAAVSTRTAAGAVSASGAASRTETVTITAAGQVSKSTGATLATTATLTAAGNVATSSGATRVGTALITAVGATNKATGASLTATASISAAGEVTATSSASLQATAQITTEGYVAKLAAADLVATGTITATGEVVVELGASLEAVATISAAGSVLVLDLADKTPLGRHLVVPAYGRELVVPASNRSLVVPASDRVFVPPARLTLVTRPSPPDLVPRP